MRQKWITRKLKENGGNKRSPVIQGLHQNVHLSQQGASSSGKLMEGGDLKLIPFHG
jgi:hypothetical protein